ncbi:MAG: division/cell wall cluster transcriptional repressor MraZ [Nitriliruptorales bacterium]|nr:division/cell wall cluster transcriptional repressor MraZ [Nitriliruptorales bacterium]
MFLGEYQHTLDPKGRVILPSAFRDELEEGLVMTVGLDHCLTIHPLADWQRVLENLRALRTTDRRERMFARMLTASAHPETLDRQGRVTIPARLREYARLRKEITVVGADSRLELWDNEAWDAYRAEGMANFADTERPFDVGGIF